MQPIDVFRPLVGSRIRGLDQPFGMDAAPRLLSAEPPADPLTRWVAKFVDFLVAWAIAQFLPVVGFFAGVTYLMIADGLQPGGSVGKRMLGLTIIGPGGRACGVRESLLRNGILAPPFALWLLLQPGVWIAGVVGWIALIGAFGLEGLLLVGNPEGQRLGDELADTRVIGVRVPGNA
jgi:uncharacterized RDD family membrane protein YckC